MPIIGLCANWNSERGRSDMPNDYVLAILRAGGTPIILPICGDKAHWKKMADMVDGFVFTGGSDIHPIRYGEETMEETNDIIEARDEQELWLLPYVKERKIPFLGICRGCQLITVGEGGTLYQDIKRQLNKEINHARFDVPSDIIHKVRVEEGSRLFSVTKNALIDVNSRHHQAIKDIPKNMKACAFSEDGIIEAIEYLDGTVGLAVQWHPESMLDITKESLPIYQWLVDEAGKREKR